MASTGRPSNLPRLRLVVNLSSLRWSAPAVCASRLRFRRAAARLSRPSTSCAPTRASSRSPSSSVGLLLKASMAIQGRGGLLEKMIPDKIVRAVAFGMQRRRDLKARWLHGKYAAVEERAACSEVHTTRMPCACGVAASQGRSCGGQRVSYACVIGDFRKFSLFRSSGAFCHKVRAMLSPKAWKS